MPTSGTRCVPSFLRQLHQNEEGEPRIYRIVAGWLANAPGVIDNDVLLPFAETLRETQPLDISELWAFAPMLKFAIVERLCANLDSERLVAASIRTLWAIEAISWKAFVETASRTEGVLRQDPAGVYSRMDLPTRDRYRLELNRLASRARLTEEDVAKAALERAEQAREAGQQRPAHVPRRLLSGGAGRERFPAQFGMQTFVRRFPVGPDRTLSERFLRRRRGGSDGAADLGIQWVAGPIAWWMLALLLIPASQAALEITNASFSRLLNPRFIPSMDFLDAIPDDCKTMVVVPTLLLSESNCAKLLKDLEIRYLANRDPNLFFALLTDFADAECGGNRRRQRSEFLRQRHPPVE